MVKVKWLKWGLVILVLGIMLTGYGGLCKKDKDTSSGSSGTTTTESGGKVWAGSYVIDIVGPIGFVEGTAYAEGNIVITMEGSIKVSQMDVRGTATSDEIAYIAPGTFDVRPSPNYLRVYGSGNGTNVTLNFAFADNPEELEFVFVGTVSGNQFSGNVTLGLQDGNQPRGTFTLTSSDSIPAAPSDLHATSISQTQIDLFWTDKSGNETGFEIYRSSDKKTWSKIGTVGDGVTTFSDTTASPLLSYYRVRSANGSITSIASNVVGLKAIEPLKDITAIAAGYDHSLALKSNGTIVAWGNNPTGALGNGTTTPSNKPVAVPGLTNITAIAAGNHFSLALENTPGTVWAWGDNDGRLGIGSTGADVLSPVVVNVGNVITMTAGGEFAFVIREDGVIWAWGYNGTGQLGIGSTENRNGPTEVTAISDVISIACGKSGHTLFLKSNGTVWACGNNGSGELGIGSTGGTSLTPVQTLGLTQVIAIGAGESFSYALKSDGTVWAWGNWVAGGTNTPVQVSGLTNVIAISTGNPRGHVLAIKSDKTAWGWGWNIDGQVGNGKSGGGDAGALSKVLNIANVIAVSTGEYCSLAIKGGTPTTVWAWGRNQNELGDGTNNGSTVPVQTIAP